jgi:protein-S-isoprenylcysteine O-methyltransferase Ste14
VDHIIGNVLGTALVIFGTFALGHSLPQVAARLALMGMVLSITGYVSFTVRGGDLYLCHHAIGAAVLGRQSRGHGAGVFPPF